MKLVFVVSALSLVSASGASRAQKPLAKLIDHYVDSLATRNAFSGTVLVARGGQVLLEKSYGNASVELGVPNTPSSRYRIHSVTKQFVAMGVAQLAERGAVDLRASVRRYLPELPAQWEAATIEQLLLHTSGIPQRENQWFESFQRYNSRTQLENLARVAPKLAADTLTSLPGTKWEYNNFAYDLLGCVIERASGKELSEFIRQSIFNPAGMTNAGFDVRAEVGNGMYVASASIPRLAYGYNGTSDLLQPGVPLMFGSAGAGGMYATARDLYQYARALDAGTLISRQGYARMIDNAYRSASDSSSRYGYGWMISKPTTGRLRVSHSGGNNGYVADFARYPNDDVCIIILSNYGFVRVEALRDTIASMVFGA